MFENTTRAPYRLRKGAITTLIALGLAGALAYGAWTKRDDISRWTEKRSNKNQAYSEINKSVAEGKYDAALAKLDDMKKRWLVEGEEYSKRKMEIFAKKGEAVQNAALEAQKMKEAKMKGYETAFERALSEANYANALTVVDKIGQDDIFSARDFEARKKNYDVRIREAKKKNGVFEANRMVSVGEYGNALLRIDELARDELIDKEELEKYKIEFSTKILNKKLEAVHGAVAKGDYWTARDAYNEIRHSLVEKVRTDIESGLTAIDPTNNVIKADELFYSRMRVDGYDKSKTVFDEDRYFEALGIINKLPHRMVEERKRLYTYRLRYLDDMFKLFDNEKTLLKEIDELARFHPGLEDNDLERDFINAALNYIASSYMDDEKIRVAEAIIDKAHIIFRMSDDERQAFLREAFRNYRNFFNYIKGNPSASDDYRYQVLTSIVRTGERHGFNTDKEILEAIKEDILKQKQNSANSPPKQ